MKIAPVYAALESSGLVRQRLIHTGQHYDRALSGVFFADLDLPENLRNAWGRMLKVEAPVG